MNNKTIIEIGFRIIWRIMEILEGVIRLGPLLDLHNSSQDTQPHSLIGPQGFRPEGEIPRRLSSNSRVY